MPVGYDYCMPQPGWYPSPRDADTLAFWDGDKWTGQTLPSQAVSEVQVNLSPGIADDLGSQQVVWEEEALDAPEQLPVEPEPNDFLGDVPVADRHASYDVAVEEPVPSDEEDDAFLVGEAPKTRRQREPRPAKAASVATEEAVEEPALVEEEDALTLSRRITGVGKRRPPLVSVPERPVRIPRPKQKLAAVPGFRGAAIAAALGLAVIAGGLFGVPAVLDPEPAGGPVAAGEVRSSAVVREVSIDGEGFCWPTVEVATGLGSGEARALKLRELNTACPVKVDEVVTVYFNPQEPDGEARFVTDGVVPVDIIMWSVVAVGGLVTLWGALRFLSGKVGRRIKFVSAKTDS